MNFSAGAGDGERRERGEAMGADPIATVWQTVKDFVAEARVVLRHPWSFPERLNLSAENLLGKGTAFVVLANAVVYLLCIPIFLAHDMQ
jgi:hypothetical protein